ncbi:MAG: sigma-70 family RNA polymerase sigma factor [Deltaproteobacteria bacterium]|nr:sigma-70 family RNA polymerase sigma factor [Deltaproteobacteria bacterium]
MASVFRKLRPGRKLPPELLHDVVVKAILGLHRWRRDCALSTWVFRIAANELAQRERGDRAAAGVADRLARESSSPPPLTPEQIATASERRCSIAGTLARVSLHRRTCVLWMDVWQRKAEDLARHLGTTSGAVREAASEARQELGPLLKRLDDPRAPPVGPPVRGLRCPAETCSAATDGWLRCPLVLPADVSATLRGAMGEKRS